MAKIRTLQNKNILLFSPSFFSYEDKIKEEMESLGAMVKLYNERSVSSSFSRALIKVFPSLFYYKTYMYYKSIIKENENIDFDYILIIRCDMVTKRVISLLRKKYPKSKLCLHLWDSIKNIKGIKKKIELFDYVTSFDKSDCLNNHKLIFRPLFYTKDFSDKPAFRKYDLCFCGTIHSDRYYVLKTLFKQAKEANLQTFSFAYLQSKFIYYFYKLFAKGFKRTNMTEFSFEKKTISEISLLEKESNVILDIQHPNQTGLTMRTIEMIGARKKFITTNQDVKNYDFYNENNILIIDRNKPVLNLHFFEKEYISLPSDVYQKYSLREWVLDVLGVSL